MASNNRGRDLIGVQNLIKKHQAMQAEINNHEPRYDCNHVDNIVAIGSGSAIFQLLREVHHLLSSFTSIERE